MTEPTRRELFTRLFRRAPAAPAPEPAARPAPAPAAAVTPIATVTPRAAPTIAIVPSLCLAWKHLGCSTCRERCPVPGAIVLDAGRPVIDAARCTGCGDCVRACPAPVMALRLTPARRA